MAEMCSLAQNVELLGEFSENQHCISVTQKLRQPNNRYDGQRARQPGEGEPRRVAIQGAVGRGGDDDDDEETSQVDARQVALQPLRQVDDGARRAAHCEQ